MQYRGSSRNSCSPPVTDIRNVLRHSHRYFVNMHIHTFGCRDPQLVMLSSNFWDIAAMMVRAIVEKSATRFMNAKTNHCFPCLCFQTVLQHPRLHTALVRATAPGNLPVTPYSVRHACQCSKCLIAF